MNINSFSCKLFKHRYLIVNCLYVEPRRIIVVPDVWAWERPHPRKTLVGVPGEPGRPLTVAPARHRPVPLPDRAGPRTAVASYRRPLSGTIHVISTAYVPRSTLLGGLEESVVGRKPPPVLPGTDQPSESPRLKCLHRHPRLRRLLRVTRIVDPADRGLLSRFCR